MTNEELKKKIVEILNEAFTERDVIPVHTAPDGKKTALPDELCKIFNNIVVQAVIPYFADALIAAGIGDLSEYKHRADKAERALHILAKNALYSVMQSDGAFVKLCYGADTAKCNACNEKCSTDDVTDEMLAECLVTESLKQAERELAEEERK